MSAEFIWRLKVVDWRVVLPHDQNFKRQRRSTALQKKLLTSRQSPFAIFSARREPRPPNLFSQMLHICCDAASNFFGED